MQRMLRLGVAIALLVACSGCSSDPTTSPEYAALEDEIEDLRFDIAAGESEIASLAAQLSEMSATVAEAEKADNADDEPLPSPVEAFKTAYESGDLDTIKDLYTEDGIITTTDKIHDLYWGNDVWLGQWDTEGTEFARLASIHQGEMIITDAIEVGDRTVAFNWAWEDFASGTAILHLRGDKIAVAVLSVSEYEIPER
jgi:hypothetical protein